jgi:hypothetical protein
VLEDGRELYGHEPDSTNQRMEITAAIEALRATSGPLTIVTDSQYVIKTMTAGWRRKANVDLWEQLEAACAGRSVTWEWTKGHDGHAGNERADELVALGRAGYSSSAPLEAPPEPRQGLADAIRALPVASSVDMLRVVTSDGRIWDIEVPVGYSAVDSVVEGRSNVLRTPIGSFLLEQIARVTLEGARPDVQDGLRGADEGPEHLFASGGPYRGLQRVAIGEFRSLVRVNLRPPVLTCQAIGPTLGSTTSMGARSAENARAPAPRT